MRSIDGTRPLSARFFVKRSVMLFVGLLALFAQLGRASGDSDDALHYTKNYFVTGDYVVAGVGLRGTGVNGFATGTINVTGIPVGADIVAAFLYWETVETTSDPSAVNGFFDGQAIVGDVRGNSNNPACSNLGATAGPAGSTGRVYRADVLRYLPVDQVNSIRLASGPHTVKLPDSGSGNGNPPLTNGASMVVVYRLLTLGTPFRAVVIFDNAFTMSNHSAAMYQKVGGFYQAAAYAGAKMTQIVANGQPGYNTTLRVNGAVISTSPFTGALGSRWDNPTFNINLSQNTSYFETSASSDDVCLTWSAIIASTKVTDTDGDGLLDIWETKGLHLDPGDDQHRATFGTCYGDDGDDHNPNSGGWTCVNLPAMGASPTRKDMYVEGDWLQGTDGHVHKPKLDALNAIGATFFSHGILVHFDVGNNYQSPASPYIVPSKYSRGGDVIQESTLLCPNATEKVCVYSEPYAVLGWKIGFRAVKDGFPALNMLPHFDHNRKDVFHYVLFAHAMAGPFDPVTGMKLTPDPSSVSGVADRGADLMLTLGLWRSDVADDDQVGSVKVQAGTLMHELGHNLGLGHAGIYRAPNCEVNYASVMNYQYQTALLTDAAGNSHVDYSSGRMNPLSENSLSETAPMGPPTNPLPYRVRFYGPVTVGGHAKTHCDGSPITDGATYVRLETLGLSTPDWNNNGKVDADVPLDVNFSGTIADGVLGGHTFLDSNDWANLNFQQVGARLNVGGLSGDVGQQDLGQQDLGQQDLGQQDLGQQDLGQQDLGQQDLGQQDLGQQDLGDVTYELAETSSPAPNNPAQPLKATVSGPAGGILIPTGIALNWGAPTGMDKIRSYNIYRTSDQNVPPSVIATVVGVPPLSTYTDTVNGTTTLYNTTYTYYETSVDIAGTESGLSNPSSNIAKHLFIKADDKSRAYGDPNPVLTFTTTGLDPGLFGTTTCTTTATQSSPVGTYPITCSGQNPAGSVTYTPGTLTITAAALTIQAASNSKSFDGNISAAAMPTVSGLKLSDTVTGLAETYDTPTDGPGKTLSVSAYTINDGNRGGNYIVTILKNTSGVIYPNFFVTTGR